MKKKDKCRGSLTVETLLFLIPFMMAFLTIINAARFVQTEMLIHHAITQTAKQISAYGYVLTKTEITKDMQSTNGKSSKFKSDVNKTVTAVTQFSDSMSDFGSTGNTIDELTNIYNSGNAAYTQLSDFFSDPDAIASGVMAMVKSDVRGAAMTYVAGELSRASIKNALGKITDDTNEYLTNLGVVDGLDGLDFSQSKWVSNSSGKGDVKIVVTYTMKNLLFPDFDFGQYEFRQCASTLMW